MVEEKDKKKTVVTKTIVSSSGPKRKGTLNIAALRKQQQSKAQEDQALKDAQAEIAKEAKLLREKLEKERIEVEAREAAAKEASEKTMKLKKNLNRIMMCTRKKEMVKNELEQDTNENKIEKEEGRNYKSPICCILGHVDTGKTKILDKLRESNVQGGEAGGITQQIGATFFPTEILAQKCGLAIPDLPGILVIDTPGHESFSNLRSRGSSLCNLAILVVDICHALEPQTIESIRLLKQRKTPFIVALNKIDRIYQWNSTEYGQFDLKKQSDYTQSEFRSLVDKTIMGFAEQELNAALFNENKNVKKVVSLVPTSAITGEGIPDLIKLFLGLSHQFMLEKMKIKEFVECTVLEVKQVEGFGLTLDGILSNGTLREGDKVALNGIDGPITATIRTLLVPQPLKELRVKSQYLSVKSVKASMGIKLVAQSLDKNNSIENAVAGSKLYVIGTKRGLVESEAIKLLKEDFQAVMSEIETVEEGVHVAANTLGSMEALLSFLKSKKVPVSNVSLGRIKKKDILKCGGMNNKFYRVILSFDVPLEKDLVETAQELDVKFFLAPIIYHLYDFYNEFTENVSKMDKSKHSEEATFPVKLRILPNCAFCSRSPLVLGVEILQGTVKLNTPLCVFGKNGLCKLGRVTSIEEKKKSVQKATKRKQVAIKIEVDRGESPKMVDRHFKATDEIYSIITRKSIDLLKEHFKDELDQEHLELLFFLKKKLNII
ncbi:IF2P [Enterospora canceri]|uniref:Eukaryotic translation initiation factor 5B n=1 Tax=Enterospora canceri TaxID=1081671 RepID=A0A1Y1S981_9MICR|nr:IF2P [Enterospora canceri]